MRTSEEIYKYYTGETLDDKQLTKKAMIEYGKQLLIEASERVTTKLDMGNEIKRTPTMWDVQIDKNSILNIINELK